MILVTGATGTNGVELIRELFDRGVRVRAFVRNRQRARGLSLLGAELVEGDFSRPETFAPALTDIDRLFLLVPSSPDVELQQRSLVDAAKRAGVKHIVKLSQFGADPDSPARFQRYHGAIEDHIRNSGLSFTFLRPNLFMQGLLNFRSTIATHGAIYACAGSGLVSVVDVRDIAAIAAEVLTKAGHDGKTYEITGPEALTHTQIAEQLSEATRKKISYIDIPPQQMKQTLATIGMPGWQAEGLVEDYLLYRDGAAARITDEVRDLTDKDPIPFLQFSVDYAPMFRTADIGAA